MVIEICKKKTHKESSFTQKFSNCVHIIKLNRNVICGTLDTFLSLFFHGELWWE